MKKIIVILLIVTVVILCAGCAEPRAEVSREPVDVRYTEAYTEIKTDYQYKYNILGSGWTLVPIVRSVHHEATWEIQYRIIYDNGDEKTEWCRCTEVEYNKIKSELVARGADDA